MSVKNPKLKLRIGNTDKDIIGQVFEYCPSTQLINDNDLDLKTGELVKVIKQSIGKDKKHKFVTVNIEDYPPPTQGRKPIKEFVVFQNDLVIIKLKYR